jgi:hypothetical protein
MYRLLLPKLIELESQPMLVRDIYLKSQCNESIDPAWEGVAVFINKGADEYLQANHRNACWYSLYEDILTSGGVDGRIGILTQYETNPLWKKQAPWIRVSCHIDTFRDNRPCYLSSVSLDARLCTTVPMRFYREAIEATLMERQRELALLSPLYHHDGDQPLWLSDAGSPG